MYMQTLIHGSELNMNICMQDILNSLDSLILQAQGLDVKVWTNIESITVQKVENM